MRQDTRVSSECDDNDDCKKLTAVLYYSVSANSTMAADVFITTGLILYLSVILVHNGLACW